VQELLDFERYSAKYDLTLDLADIHILLVDPRREFSFSFEKTLVSAGYRVTAARTDASAIKIATVDLANIVIKSFAGSLEHPGLMERLRAICPDTEFIFTSAVADVRMAMQAVRRGAFDCLPLPCEGGQLLESISRALNHQKIAAENPEILGRLGSRSQPNILAGSSAVMREIQATVDRVAATDVTILITGESGTGKEMIARMVHERSGRKKGPFVAVNCAALPDSIIESEFFGHVRGAFTGAVADKPGRFELARGGTLFLDEIGDLSAMGQADLLRVLEDGIFRPLGSRTTVHADARIIAATNRKLEERCRSGQFREDLLYRLNVITLHMMPLRQRPEDIPGLAETFVRHFCAKHRIPAKSISRELDTALQGLPWPGNVRQLRNAVERMVLLSRGRILKSGDLPGHLLAADPPGTQPFLRAGMKLSEVEASWIRITLERCGGNRAEAARQLGISRRSLHYRLKDKIPGKRE